MEASIREKDSESFYLMSNSEVLFEKHYPNGLEDPERFTQKSSSNMSSQDTGDANNELPSWEYPYQTSRFIEESFTGSYEDLFDIITENGRLLI